MARNGTSPFVGVPKARWRQRTVELINAHPLKGKELVEVTLEVWEDVFRSGIGKKPFRIGVDISPNPQIMGFFLHALIPLEFARRYPEFWRGERDSRDKDLVYIPDDLYSVEIKTSSHPTRIFGNRSYAQVTKTRKKSKSGYYLAVNSGKFAKHASGSSPRVIRIRFGWLDAGDWRGQEAASGQKASLPPEVDASKLIEIFPKWEL